MSDGAGNPSLLENTFYNTVNFVPGFKVTINPRTWQSLTITKPKFLRRFWILWFWQVWDWVLDNLNQISKINFLSKKWNSLQPCLSSTDLVYELRRSIPRSGPNVQMSTRSDARPLGLPKLGQSFYAKFIFLINARQIQSKFLKLVFLWWLFCAKWKSHFRFDETRNFPKIRNFRISI